MTRERLARDATARIQLSIGQVTYAPNGEARVEGDPAVVIYDEIMALLERVR